MSQKISRILLKMCISEEFIEYYFKNCLRIIYRILLKMYVSEEFHVYY